jgi:hypothetical protein
LGFIGLDVGAVIIVGEDCQQLALGDPIAFVHQNFLQLAVQLGAEIDVLGYGLDASRGCYQVRPEIGSGVSIPRRSRRRRFNSFVAHYGKPGGAHEDH